MIHIVKYNEQRADVYPILLHGLKSLLNLKPSWGVPYGAGVKTMFKYAPYEHMCETVN